MGQPTKTISIPDQVRCAMTLADVGQRIRAMLIDILIQIPLFLGSFSLLFQVPSLGLALAFIVSIAYHPLFELWLNGQTPGKMVVGIRVIRADGGRIDAQNSIVRNLFRVIDAQFFYGPALLCCLIDRDNRRLGDIVGGTLVVQEDPAAQIQGVRKRLAAMWLQRIERGESRAALILPNGELSLKQLGIIEQLILTVSEVDRPHWEPMALKLGQKVAKLAGETVTTPDEALDLLVRIQAQAMEGTSSNKADGWEAHRKLLGKRLKEEAIPELLENHRKVVADLARAQAMGADERTLAHLNQLVYEGHRKLSAGGKREPASAWWASFGVAICRQWTKMALASFLLFVPAIGAAVALQYAPELAYSIVPIEFQDHIPARVESMHDFAVSERPLAATTIIQNNIQVSFLAAVSGITCGIGTIYILIHNGIVLGSVIGWFAVKGQAISALGWVMPHGGLEMIAIAISGGVGLMVADALILPGVGGRKEALRKIGMDLAHLIVGIIVMLLIAGLIEGFVSPSAIGIPTRVGILLTTVALFFGYVIGTALKFHRVDFSTV